MTLDLVDSIIIIDYFAVILFVGFYYSSKKNSPSEYFLAGRSLKWPLVGTSLFSTHISSEHFVGLAGAGYVSGLAVGNWEYQGAIGTLLLAWVFGSIFIKAEIYTLPEFLEKRFNSLCRRFMSIGSMMGYIFTKISVCLLAGAIFFEEVVGFDIYSSSLLLVIATGLYSVGGGLRPIAYTQLFQTVLLIGGALLLTILGIIEVGGISKLITLAPENHFNLLKPFSDKDFPWTGVIFGIPIVTIWYFCTDQFMVQRFLSAKDIDNARGGSIFSGYMMFLIVPLLLIPGIIAKILFPDIRPDSAYSTMVSILLPVGLKGLVIAAFLAALMSSLAAAFHSCSTLFTYDIYLKMYPNATDFILVNIGRLATFVLVIIAVIWVTFMKSLEGELFIYLQSVSGYIGAPITAIFLIGILWPRANGTSAVTALIAGFVLGMSRFIIEILVKKKIITSGFLHTYGSINFLHFTIFLFLACVLIMIIVSLCTEKPTQQKVDSLTVKYEDAPLKEFKPYMAETEDGRTYNIILSAILVFLVITIYIFFSN